MAFPKKQENEKHIKQALSFPPEIHQRLLDYCQKEERSMSWVAQKALDAWLKERGY